MTDKQTPKSFTAAGLEAIIARLKNGAALIAESKGLGFTHNGPLRAALRAHLGAEGYDALMTHKRPISIGAPRHTADGVVMARALPDDSGVPLVPSMKRQDGWSWRYVNEHEPIPRSVQLPKGGGTARVMDTGRRILVSISPDGAEYTQAGMYEPADLLRTNPLDDDGPPSRFILWEKSAQGRAAEKGEKRAERLQEHIEAQREVKAAKKAAPVMPAPEPPKKAKRVSKTALDLTKPVDAKLAAAAFKAGIVKAAPARRGITDLTMKEAKAIDREVKKVAKKAAPAKKAAGKKAPAKKAGKAGKKSK